MEVEEVQIPYSIPLVELPQQLINSEIMVRLPIKSLIQLKVVSKEWKSIISSPEFAKLHLHFQRSSPNYSPKLLFGLKDEGTSCLLVFDFFAYEKGDNPFYSFRDTFSGTKSHVWGCSEGLVLIGFPYVDSLHVWNPATRESRMIPYPTCFPNYGNFRGWGFGHVSSLDDYRIVVFSTQFDVITDYTNKYEPKAFTLSLKAGTWKQIGFLNGIDLYVLAHDISGVLVDEMSYWIVENSFGKLCIVGFDLASEEFKELEPPQTMEGNIVEHLSVIGGCLCFVSSYEDSGKVDISMLKDQGCSTALVKFYTFYQPFDPELLCLNVSRIWSGKFIMCTSAESLVFIDMSRDPPEFILIGEWHDGYPDRVKYYEETLVSPFTPSIL